MKTAVVVPTLNAVKRGCWYELLRAIAEQHLQIDLKLIIDSDSTDQTVELAVALGWKCLRHDRRNFNHGLTRARIVRYLASKGFDTVIFLSQDVVLSEPGTLEKLTDFLWKHPEISGCCGKQISLHEKTLNAWQRERCYPNDSKIRTAADIPRDGLMAAFFSNAFAAWKIHDVIRFGNFPKTDFGEDTLLAAHIIENGGAVGYCAEAIAIHEHSNAPFELFRRGWQIGNFHRLNPGLLRRFRDSSMIARKSIPAGVILPLAIKVMGYFSARFRNIVLPGMLFFLLWFLLAPCIILEDYPLPDVATRYAPMAEAFARHDWLFAFHPRITPLLPVSAGLISFVFHCGGFLACKLASALFLSLSIFPLYAATRRLFGHPVALCTSILFIVCPYLIRFGYYGSRESGTIFGLLLCVYAAVLLSQRSRGFAPWIWFVLGETVILLSRGDMLLFASLLFAALFIWDGIRFRIPFRSTLTGFAILILISPLLCCNRRMIGYPVLDTRHTTIFKYVSQRIPTLKQLVYPDPVMQVDFDAPAEETVQANIFPVESGTTDHADVPDANVPDTSIPDANVPDTSIPDANVPDTSIPVTNPPDTGITDTNVPVSSSSAVQTHQHPLSQRLSKFLKTIWGGIFPFFLFFAAIGIIGRIRRRQWTGFDTLQIMTFLVFELLAAFQVCLFYGLLATSRRYLFIGIPLYLQYTALGFRDFWRILTNLRFGKTVAACLAFLLCAAFFYKLYSPIFTEFFHDSAKGIERSIQFAAADWIRSDWDKIPVSREAPIQTLKCDQYQSGKRPLVRTNSKWTRLGFLAGGQIYPEYLRSSNILPDYIVLPEASFAENNQNGLIPESIIFGENKQDGINSKPYRQVHVDTVDGVTFAVFRDAALQPGN